MTLPATELAALGICLLAAAAWDAARRRIPNALTAIVGALGLGVQGSHGGLWAALSGAVAGILAIAVLYRPWLAGGIGGGDVKLAAAAAIWIGLSRQLVVFALATALAGGVVAALCFALSGRTARRQIQANLTSAAILRELPMIDRQPARQLVPARVSVPYGAAVAAGAFLALCGPWGR
ncbi:MAG TPA: A24 family peptidase [Polyangia bacterium]|nr:A24 family peptidase [Polyangia bacterium]